MLKSSRLDLLEPDFPRLIVIDHLAVEAVDGSADVYKNLLMKNRDVVHGAFVLDEGGTRVIFRDTLQIENLDLNELEGSLNSLSLLLSEYSQELIQFSKNCSTHMCIYHAHSTHTIENKRETKEEASLVYSLWSRSHF